MRDVLKPLAWIASSLDDLRGFPEDVQDEVGHALLQAQRGRKHASAKPLQGFGGASVLEVVENHDGDTYRAVYTVRWVDAVYVLHCFQKKSKSGAATPKQDMDLVRSRLKIAEEMHQKWIKKQK